MIFGKSIMGTFNITKPTNSEKWLGDRGARPSIVTLVLTCQAPCCSNTAYGNALHFPTADVPTYESRAKESGADLRVHLSAPR